MSYPPWPDWTVEQWRAARVQSIAKYDPSQPRQPKGSAQGGEFASKAPVLQGVDSKANVKALIDKHHAFHKGLTGQEPDSPKYKAAEDELRALPLIHGTTFYGAIGAAKEGLLSHADMAPQAAKLIEDAKELRQEILNVLHKDSEDKTYVPHLAGFRVEDLRRMGFDRSTAEELIEKIEELTSIEQVVKGTTYPEDTKLGLDQFVFMTHGQKHQDYGNIAVVIDNEVIQEGWATEQDIVTTPGVTLNRPESGLKNAEYAGVENYQKTITKGDDYYAVAAARAGSPEAVLHRSREQLFEMKAPRVPKSAVKGFVVEDDFETAQHLADGLAKQGLTNKVLFISESYGTRRKAFLNEQLKILQSSGAWDEEAIDKFREEHEGVYLL